MSLHEEDNTKQKYGKSFDFCSIHVYLQPHDPLEDEKTSLAYEGFKMKETVREMNSLLVSSLVITKSLQRRMMLSMVIRNILDYIQKDNIDQI